MWAATKLRHGTLMAKQLLHLVFGGELTDPQSTEFRDLSKLDIVGIYPNYKTAYEAWREKAQATVDNAHMRYFIVHMHRLLEPESAHDESEAPRAASAKARG
jgi:hypothetical protein